MKISVMKKLLFLIPVFLLLLCACDNREDEFSNEAYTGTWKWVSTAGPNVNETPLSTGKTVSLDFTSEWQYTISENDVEISSGTYSLYEDVSSTDHQQRMFIKFSADGIKIVKEINATTLSLQDDDVTGLTYHHEK